MMKELDKDPLITIDTIHSVKGGEANHVVFIIKVTFHLITVMSKREKVMREEFET